MKEVKNKFSKLLSFCPRAFFVTFIIAFSALLLNLAFLLSAGFSDFYNRYIGSAVRIVLAKITGIYPASLAESVLITMPLWLIALICMIIKVSRDGIRSMVRFTAVLLSVLFSFYSIFVLGFASGYNGSSVEEKLGIDRHDVSADELRTTAIILKDKINSLTDSIKFGYQSFSYMPYSISEMNDKLISAYSGLSEKYDFFPDFSSRVKKIMLSEPMTYTHISGVYTYFTGEANININFPDYTLPFTAAHELAHQRGISREDEANFIAFLACAESDDPYIQYSGYLGVYEYVISALYQASPDMYREIAAELDIKARYEMAAYNDFFEKYRKNVVATVSEKVNDTYLQIQGQKEGTKSYGRVVDLAVAYYEDEGR